MGIPASRLLAPTLGPIGQRLGLPFGSQPAQGMGQMFGGQPFQMPQGQQPNPFDNLGFMPEAVPRLAPQEMDALRERILGRMQQRFNQPGRFGPPFSRIF